MNIFLFHRDLRLIDNTSLIKQLRLFKKVTPIFIFPPEQINPKQNKFFSHNSVQFMVQSLQELEEDICSLGGKMYYFKGPNLQVVEQIHQKQRIASIGFNLDYTPYAKERDEQIINWAHKNEIHIITEQDYGMYKLLDPKLINPKNGKPFSVFTPFKKHMQSQFEVSLPDYFQNFIFEQFETLEKIQFFMYSKQIDKLYEPNPNIAVRGGRKNGLAIFQNIQKFSKYQETRDFPILPSSKLSAYLHFTTVSIRQVYHAFSKKFGPDCKFIDELHWREFFYYIGHHFPHTLQGDSFQKKFDSLKWKYNKNHLEAWKNGTTGFPIVDAAMRELNTTGWTHNRTRQIVASFLAKDLFLNWHFGQKYFSNKLVDYSVMQNSGGWQWTVGNGTEAAQYSRVFNPWMQQKKYDLECQYIKKWIPELRDVPVGDIHNWEKCHDYHLKKGVKYYAPIVDHFKAKKEALQIIEGHFKNK